MYLNLVGARATNYGTRIDYIFADHHLATKAVEDCVVLSDVQGSDHCPVKATLTWELLPCKRCPPLCTKYMPEFSGKQQKLDIFLTKKSKVVPAKEDTNSKKNPCVQTENSSIEPSVSVTDKVSSHSGQQIKRHSSSSQISTAKKLRKDGKQPSSSKQASLMSFFNAKNPSGSKAKETREDVLSQGSTSLENAADANSAANNKRLEDANSRSEDLSAGSAQPPTAASNHWKNLLRGPLPPPLCKGHKEPCVIRTVKKESLNKGRQFYVCNRPDGHKTNPEARCDHFEWADKKKK